MTHDDAVRHRDYFLQTARLGFGHWLADMIYRWRSACGAMRR